MLNRMLPKQTNYRIKSISGFRAMLNRMLPKHKHTKKGSTMDFRAMLNRIVFSIDLNTYAM